MQEGSGRMVQWKSWEGVAHPVKGSRGNHTGTIGRLEEIGGMKEFPGRKWKGKWSVVSLCRQREEPQKLENHLFLLTSQKWARVVWK